MPVLSIRNLTKQKLATRGSFGDIGPDQLKAKNLTVAQIEQLRPFLIRMEQAGVIAWDVGQYDLTDADAEFVTAQDAGVSGGGALEILDEGLSLGNFSILNFVGADIQAAGDLAPGQVNIFVPPPSFRSHWNTSDGSNGNQSVSESISRTTARISTPSGGEGTPFRTGGWAGTNQPATLNTNATFTTPGTTTGWGGDSTLTVQVFDADGTTVLDSYTTPPIVGNVALPSPSGNITVNITSYGPDGTRFQARASVTVVAANILTLAGYSGGRYSVRITHTTDSGTDGTGPFIYNQPSVFIDTNPTSPSINGIMTLTETVGFVTTKHISGIEYYTLGSRFTVGITDIDGLNGNTQRIPSNVQLIGTEFGLPTLDHAPYPAASGAANFSGWTNDDDQDDVDYTNTAWAITATNFRYIGPSANSSSFPREPWGDGVTVNSADQSILVDTFSDTATNLFEPFNGEARREDPASFPGPGTWNSTATLIAGQALVFGGSLLAPGSSTYIRSDGPNSPNANWLGFLPNLGGPNPNYTGLTVPVSYGRRFTQASAANIPSFSMVFTGTFAAGSAIADLTGGNLEIEVYRIAGLGTIGPPPGNTRPLRVHLPFNFALYNDGLTVPGSGIREGSSAGNTINCTFGTGTPAQQGFYMVLRILNAGTSIDSISVTLF